MAELDKKISKAQTDLVQAVLEAQEKRNLERVDMLVTNAIKQLKMSRFKPDQTTCISLTYLARISPKVFIQSSAIKEVLKSSLRRETGPANIKGKNDILFPVLSANILLACCDATEVRLIILNKIEQWLSSNQKVAEIVQHLLATICMKCQGDQKTIAMLIEMRQHWLQYLEGSVPSDLCASIRNLLHTETSCSSLIIYLKFLIKHDNDVEGLSRELARFIIERPMSLDSMLNEDESAVQLIQMILRVFIKLFLSLSDSNGAQTEQTVSTATKMLVFDEGKRPIESDVTDVTEKSRSSTIATEVPPNVDVIIKQEPKEPSDSVQCDNKIEVDTSEKGIEHAKFRQKDKSTTKADLAGTTHLNGDSTDTTTMTDEIIRPSLYVKLASSSRIISLNRPTTEAVIRLMALVEINEDCKEEFNQLLDFWRIGGDKVDLITTIYQDAALTTPHNLSNRLRQMLIHSSNGCLIELGLQNADVSQLVDLIQQFGLPLNTINKIFKRLGKIKNAELIKSHVKDQALFGQLLEFYDEMGALGAKELNENLGLAISSNL